MTDSADVPSTPGAGSAAGVRWLPDLALALAVGLVGVLSALPDPLTGALAVGLSAPLAIRRAFPVTALVIAAAAATAQLVLLEVPSVTGVAVPILVYTAARWSGGPTAPAVLGVATVGALAGPLRWLLPRHEQLTAGALITTVIAYQAVVLGAYVVGARAREREERHARRERAAIAERDRAASAAAADERNRIAREVHDIVAHSLSVIAVQADGGRALAARRPERAAEVLGVIAGAAREALDEVRELVTMLRAPGADAGSTDAPEAGLRPTRGPADLAELAARAGDRVRLRVHGDPSGIGPLLGLTVYRVVQESVTNFLRHAGPAASLDVTVTVGPAEVEIIARDDGLGASAAGAGRGHGLASMRERVLLHGGRLSAGHGERGGFVVRAGLPLGRSVAAR